MNPYRLNRTTRQRNRRVDSGSENTARSLRRIRSFVMSNPMLITGFGHASIMSVLDAADQPHKREDGVDVCGEAVSVAQPAVVGTTGIIPIGGVVVNKAQGFERGSGAVDLADIRQELRAFDQDPEIDHIILDIDSPGGTVQGTIETARFILNSETPITAFSDGQISSAAFWMASQADSIFTTESTEVGSVGVFMAILDQSEAFKQQGLNMQVISAGKFKGIGIPGTSLTDEQLQMLQAEVDSIHDEFKLAVLGKRGIDEEDMEGQVYSSQVALEKGFIDGMVESIDDLITL